MWHQKERQMSKNQRHDLETFFLIVTVPELSLCQWAECTALYDMFSCQCQNSPTMEQDYKLRDPRRARYTDFMKAVYSLEIWQVFRTVRKCNFIYADYHETHKTHDGNVCRYLIRAQRRPNRTTLVHTEVPLRSYVKHSSFPVQLSWNLLSEDISCTECYQNRMKDTKNFVQFHWHPSVKYDCHYTDFNDTHNSSVSQPGDLKRQIWPNSVTKYGKCGINSLTPFSKIRLSTLIFMKLTRDRRFAQNVCTQFHEKPTNGLVADIWSGKGRSPG